MSHSRVQSFFVGDPAVPTFFSDCIHFQEKLLDQQLIFTAGIAEAKSKGRGEECISQNLRILRARNGRQILIFFCNSQRKEKKRYISIPRKIFFTSYTLIADTQGSGLH